MNGNCSSQACRRAMRLQVRRINHHRSRRGARIGQGRKDPIKHARLRPAHETVVECLVRPKDRRCILAHQPVADHVVRREIDPLDRFLVLLTPADHPPVIDTRNAARLVRKKRLQALKLRLGQPEVVVGHRKLPTFGSRNHISTVRGIPFMDPEPRCLIPRFDGAIHSLEWKEALWDKFVTGAPRTVTRQAISEGNLPRGHARSPSSNTAIASFDRGVEQRARYQSEDGREVAEAADCRG